MVCLPQVYSNQGDSTGSRQRSVERATDLSDWLASGKLILLNHPCLTVPDSSTGRITTTRAISMLYSIYNLSRLMDTSSTLVFVISTPREQTRFVLFLALVPLFLIRFRLEIQGPTDAKSDTRLNRFATVLNYWHTSTPWNGRRVHEAWAETSHLWHVGQSAFTSCAFGSCNSSQCGNFLTDKWLGKPLPDPYGEGNALTPSQRKASSPRLNSELFLTWSG